jgi:hypothetical protein
MADTITNVLFKLESDSSKLRSDLKNVNTDLDNTKKSSSEASATFSQMGQGLRALAQQAGLGGLVQSFDLISTAAKTTNNSVKQIGTGVTSATGATNKWGRALKLALIPLAIMATTMVAITSALTRTQEGLNAIRSVTNKVSQQWEGLIGLAQEYGNQLLAAGGAWEAIGKIFTDSFEIIKDGLDIITGEFNKIFLSAKLSYLDFIKSVGNNPIGGFLIDADAFDKEANRVKNQINDINLRIQQSYDRSFKKLEDTITASNKRAELITKATEALELAELNYQIVLRDTESSYIRNNNILQDVNKTLEERIKAGEAIKKAEADRINALISIKEEEVKIAKLKADANRNTIQDNIAIAKIETEIIELKTRAEEGSERVNKRLNSIILAAKKEEYERQVEILELQGEGIKIVEKEYDYKIDFLKQYKSENIQTQEEINQLIELLEQDKLKTIAQMQKDMRLDMFNDELSFLQTRNEIELLKLKESLANFKGTEEEKAEFIRDQTRTQILLLQTELEKLQSLDEILTPDEAQQLELNIQKIKTEIAQLGETLNDVTADDLDNFQENFLAVTDTIGQAFDQVFDIIAKRTSAELDRINEAINKSQGNIDEALELAKRGNVEALQIERARQEALERQREIAIQREEQQARRAIATQQALAAARILAEVFTLQGAVTLPTKLALAGSLIGLLGSLVPAFEKGTDYAPEGWAVVDEKGAEIRTDKRGNIKSLGSNKGARMVYNELGDKIIPAHKSRAIIDSLGVQDVKDRDDKKEIARAIGKLQSNTNVIIDKNGLYVGIKGVKQQMTRAWQ